MIVNYLTFIFSWFFIYIYILMVTRALHGSQKDSLDKVVILIIVQLLLLLIGLSGKMI